MLDPRIRPHVENDAFAKSLGIEWLELREGFAQCAMVVRESMLNFHGTMHGGAIFALADTAFGAACNTRGQTTVALEMNISFLAPVMPGTRLIAEAQEEGSSARVGLYHIVVKDESGQVVASSHGTGYRKKEWFAK